MLICFGQWVKARKAPVGVSWNSRAHVISLLSLGNSADTGTHILFAHRPLSSDTWVRQLARKCRLSALLCDQTNCAHQCTVFQKWHFNRTNHEALLKLCQRSKAKKEKGWLTVSLMHNREFDICRTLLFKGPRTPKRKRMMMTSHTNIQSLWRRQYIKSTRDIKTYFVDTNKANKTV